MEVWRLFCRFFNLTLRVGGVDKVKFLVLRCQEERVFSCRFQAACHHGTVSPGPVGGGGGVDGGGLHAREERHGGALRGRCDGPLLWNERG